MLHRVLAVRFAHRAVRDNPQENSVEHTVVEDRAVALRQHLVMLRQRPVLYMYILEKDVYVSSCPMSAIHL